MPISRIKKRIRGSSQEWRHSETVVASRRMPPQRPQVTHGAKLERRPTAAGLSASTQSPPRVGARSGGTTLVRGGRFADGEAEVRWGFVFLSDRAIAVR